MSKQDMPLRKWDVAYWNEGVQHALEQNQTCHGAIVAFRNRTGRKYDVLSVNQINN